MEGRGLHRFACATALATFVLLLAGGQVTTTGSGDAVPDWWFLPISYGSLLPRMVGGIFWEHGHRLVAAVVGLMTVSLALWAWRRGATRDVRLLAAAAAVAVVLQGCLGGLRVLLVAPGSAYAVVHAVFAQVFFCLTVVLALRSAPGRRTPAARSGADATPLPWLAAATSAALFLQLCLGALLRHRSQALLAHILGATLVLALVVICVTLVLARHRDEGALLRPAAAMGALLALQFGLGLGSLALILDGFERSIYAARLHMAVITGHQSVGGLLLAASLLLSLSAWERLPRRSPQLACQEAGA